MILRACKTGEVWGNYKSYTLLSLLFILQPQIHTLQFLLPEVMVGFWQSFGFLNSRVYTFIYFSSWYDTKMKLNSKQLRFTTVPRLGGWPSVGEKFHAFFWKIKNKWSIIGRIIGATIKAVLSKMVATGHMELLSVWNVAGANSHTP